MRAFVTGSTGFLGIHLVQQLVRDGWEVFVLHRPTSDLSELRKVLGLHYVVGDVRDKDSLHRGMPDCVDAVFHAASSVGFLKPEDEKDQYETNVLGTRNVVEVALSKAVGRFVHTSTVLTYDYSRGRVTEESAPNDSRKYVYIHSKRLAELEVMKGVQNGLNAVTLNPTAIFGAHDKATWSKVFREINRGLRVPFAPPSRASFCHMRKVAEAHVSAFSNGRTGEHYILGGPDASIMEITTEIARILNRRGPFCSLPGFLFKLFGRLEYKISTILRKEPMVTPSMADILCETVLCDSAKAIRELGYEPSSIQTMLLDCYQWMVGAGMLHTSTPLKGNVLAMESKA